jgi:phenylpyruvate tautomerase PptA (4-oxalocrotonate tautomerase family)
MPIVHALIVVEDGGSIAEGTAKLLADVLGAVFAVAPGKVWVRVQSLPESQYAENGSAASARPVFLSVLHADQPAATVLASQAAEIARAVGGCLGRPLEHVHVEYAPPGRGRVAFGGSLLQ